MSINETDVPEGESRDKLLIAKEKANEIKQWLDTTSDLNGVSKDIFDEKASELMNLMESMQQNHTTSPSNEPVVEEVD